MKQIILRKRNLILLFIPLGIILNEWAKSSAFIAEELFAKRIYKVISQGMGVLTGWIPFSIAELLVVVGPLVLVFLLARQMIRVIRVKKLVKEEQKNIGQIRFVLIMTALQNLLCLVSIIFFVYILLCGINYHRYSIQHYLGLSVENSSVEELEGLLIELADRATFLRTHLTEDEDGVYILPMSKRELGKEVKKAYENLTKVYEIFAGSYPAPKPVFFSKLMSYTQITGVFTCWTMEANVNIDISPYSVGSTMCHELAHLHGFMREEEANYISYIACLASDCIDLQYSGTMLALIYTGNALYRKDAKRYFEVYKNHYSEAVARDLIANNEYWDKFEDTKVAETAEKVNNTYLKANNQTDGTQSYGRVVDLLLAEYRQRHEVNVQP